jgi:prolyl-tRNA synthetase
MAKELGITVKKSEDFAKWYTEVVQKAELIDYSDVSGCYILRPYGFAIWETLVSFVDARIKEKGVKNVSFPLFIPESLLKKEEDHVEGFTPEVAWVTHSGESKLNERLAIRPTSETIFYPSYAKWIRSHRDLPLRLNQWANVVRWEFSECTPFLRSREFFWQEGHTAFATKKEADEEVLDILDLYRESFEDLFAVPVFKGLKSEKEKFAGADYTTSVETFLPVGKAIQGATSHALGQNFAKAFDIQFFDEKEKKQFVWQNSWGISSRSVGVMIIAHGDDKGLVLPPKVAPIQVVVVPILFDKSRDEVLAKVKELEEKLMSFRVEVDLRDHSPGWKFNEWELKGVPVRIEIGPKDVTKGHVVVARRDNGEKEFVKFEDVASRVQEIMDDIQSSLLTKAKKFMTDSLVTVSSVDDFKKAVTSKKMARAFWCGSKDEEQKLKDDTKGAKSLNFPFAEEEKGVCFVCSKKDCKVAYFAKSY